MSLKVYTITQNGNSNGNIIAQPFTIEVHKMEQIDANGIQNTVISTCTKNGSDDPCHNDNIAGSIGYDLEAMTKSDNAKLASTLEVDLEAAYPGKWS